LRIGGGLEHAIEPLGELFVGLERAGAFARLVEDLHEEAEENLILRRQMPRVASAVSRGRQVSGRFVLTYQRTGDICKVSLESGAYRVQPVLKLGGVPYVERLEKAPTVQLERFVVPAGGDGVVKRNDVARDR